MFDSLINTLLVAAGLYVYLALLRQVALRSAGAPSLDEKQFGVPEAIAAALLVSWFLLTIFFSIKAEHLVLDDAALISTAAFSLGVIAALSALLIVRGFNLLSLGGFYRLNFGRTVSTAAVLLFAAYPLLGAAEVLGRWWLGQGSGGEQQIIEMFTGSQTLNQRIMIIVLAISVAPMAEEFIFRFFLYGVLKRYLGRGLGLFLNALLFGAVHVHLPSLVPLFVLGGCLTLAYEWSGSILVPMTMHALFNFLTLSALAFPGLLSQ